MREMTSVILEGALDGKLDDALGYSKYDYKKRIQTTAVTVTARKLCILDKVILKAIFKNYTSV